MSFKKTHWLLFQTIALTMHITSHPLHPNLKSEKDAIKPIYCMGFIGPQDLELFHVAIRWSAPLGRKLRSVRGFGL